MRVPSGCAPLPHARQAPTSEAREVAVVDRQVLDLLGRNGEGPLRALRLHERRFGRDIDGFRRAAGFERQRRHRHTVAAADADARRA